MGKHVKSPYKNEAGNVVTCPVCGKSYAPAPFHVYHEPGYKSKRVCSYTCMLTAERRHEENKKATGAAAHKKKTGRPKK